MTARTGNEFSSDKEFGNRERVGVAASSLWQRVEWEYYRMIQWHVSADLSLWTGDWVVIEREGDLIYIR